MAIMSGTRELLPNFSTDMLHRSRNRHTMVLAVRLLLLRTIMDFCFVCNRPTDHRAEHDDLVEAGLASYDPEEGIVRSHAE